MSKGRKPKEQIEIKKPEFELTVRPKLTKDLVAFDFGLLFKEGTQEVQIYVDELLQQVINDLLSQHKSVILKTNFYSPDVIFLVGDTVHNAL